MLYRRSEVSLHKACELPRCAIPPSECVHRQCHPATLHTHC